MMMPPSSLAVLTALALFAAGAPNAQAPSDPLTAEEAFVLSVEQAGDELTLSWDIADGYYLYRDHLGAEGPEEADLPLRTPDGEMKDDPNFGVVEVYYDAVIAQLEAEGGPVTVTWQGCKEDSICYPPQTRVFEIDGAGGATTASGAGFEATKAGTSTTSTGGGTGLTLADDPGILDGLSARGGTALVVAGFLGLGLLLAFTPCVFPMFPIVAGMVIGQREPPGIRRGLTLSGAYVIAMATAFAGLGIVAAWSGQNLQVVLQSPTAIGVAAAIFVLLALSMFGMFNLQMPRVIAARLEGAGGRGGSLGGAALLGFTSALIVGPCVTAPLAGALLYIAQTGDVDLGALALFALGLGQGLPLLAIGAFGPRVLPKSGAWMEGAKRVFGVLFLGFAIWLAGRVLPGPLTLALWSALLIGVGVVLAQAPRDGMAGRLGSALGVIVLFAGVLQGVGAAVGADDPTRPLAPFAARSSIPEAQAEPFSSLRTKAALETALTNSNRPTLAYVTAEWCTTCRSIEQGLLSDPRLQAALAGLSLLKVDVTEFGAESQVLLDLLGAAGPPTMVFFDEHAAEVPGTRLVGDTDSGAMLRSARMVSQ
ncbi:protein-disulfide reductase DsbD [Citreimonas salinaria]|uniref:Thiol:disulfide interchange protein DsbD n=1 Tax=Citreimonas salinaria TaxID=321339 RepID=A0A1H3NLU5_9RHOB|nr:protein-disulfide reductase DsbD [Citreimonas salinaria]SDY89784.1 thiol:disulfide interchange protein DsbD [Citreimonas salinaria]